MTSLAGGRCGPRLVLGLWVAAFAAAGCERREERPGATVDDGVPRQEHGLPAELSPGFALAAEKTGPRSYQLRGWAEHADSVRIEVEDGHNVLFGPVTLAVVDQRFSVDFRHEPTDRDHIFVYVTDGAGARLAVVPVDTALEMTSAGPRVDLAPAPEPRAYGDHN